jgi:hypothetical protein
MFLLEHDLLTSQGRGLAPGPVGGLAALHRLLHLRLCRLGHPAPKTYKSQAQEILL